MQKEKLNKPVYSYRSEELKKAKQAMREKQQKQMMQQKNKPHRPLSLTIKQFLYKHTSLYSEETGWFLPLFILIVFVYLAVDSIDPNFKYHVYKNLLTYLHN